MRGLVARRELDAAAFGQQIADAFEQLRMIRDQPARPVPAPGLLVRCRDEEQVPIETLVGTGQLQQCHQVGHGDPLGVEGSSSPDIAILDAAREGRHAPLGGIRGHGVEMREQDQSRPIPAAAQSAPDRRSGLSTVGIWRRNDIALDPLSSQDLPEPIRKCLLASRRIDRLHPDRLGQDLGGALLDGRPGKELVEGPCGVGRCDRDDSGEEKNERRDGAQRASSDDACFGNGTKAGRLATLFCRPFSRSSRGERSRDAGHACDRIFRGACSLDSRSRTVLT